jgi:hypothetical protein
MAPAPSPAPTPPAKPPFKRLVVFGSVKAS